MGRRSLSDPLARAALEDDHEAFDALVDARPVWTRLAASLDDRAALEARMPRRGGLIDVGEALAAGRPGLWLATAWLFEALPTIRAALAPAHERWDVLIEQRRDAPEAPWLSAELAAALGPRQGALRRRVTRGYRRRFEGARGVRIWARRIDAAR